MKHVFALLLFSFVLPDRALGYKPGSPRTFQRLSTDGRFVFVMVSPIPVDEEMKPWNAETGAELRTTREKWPISGMYRNDGSNAPLWTVDWYAYHVDVPQGGEHVVRYAHRFESRDFAIQFYRNGELTASYRVDELSQFIRAGEYYEWLAESYLNEADGTLSIKTTTYEWYTFDVRTGETTSRFRPVVYAIRGLIVIGVLLPAWLLWRWRRRRKASVSLAD